MNVHILGATTIRILRQLRHDPRTVALLLVVPVVLMGLIYAMFSADSALVNQLLVVLLGIFPFMVMFLITSIAMLRERTSGTLERLMTTPVGQADLLFGYGLAFGVAGLLQSLVAGSAAYLLYDVQTKGSVALVLLTAVLTAVLGVGIGLFCSAFARTEFQAVQLLPIVVLPQVILCGLFVPRESLPGWLELLSDVLPLSYAVDAMQEVSRFAEPTAALWRDLGIVAGCAVLALGLAAGTMRRRTA